MGNGPDFSEPPRLTIRGVHVTAVDVPLERPLQTGGGLVRSAPLALIDLETREGLTGSSYLFCVTPAALKPMAQLLENLAEWLAGKPLAPYRIERMLHERLRLLGVQGLTGMAIAGLDMAAWDAYSKSCGLPLVRALGGEPTRIPAYNSCGLGLIGVDRVGREASELASGFKALKVRLGYPDLATDIAVIRTVREAVGSEVHIMSDYNQCLPVAEALRRCRRLDEEGLYWIEEPTTADDHEGNATITREARTPIQIGENWWGPRDMLESLSTGASDFGMPDVMRIGGVSGWLRAAGLAETRGIPLSSHLFPEISAHLLAVTPTCHWLEYVDWASPILAEPVKVEQGYAVINEAPGTGIRWNDAAVAKWRL
jgi:mandelate racemase